MAKNVEKEKIIEMIKELDKQGVEPGAIGLRLRDQHGIPSVKKMGLRMSDYTTKREIPADLYNLLVQAVSVHAHMDRNKKDSTSKHGLEKIESKIRRLAKYYIRKGALPAGWRYTIESARLL